MMTFIVIIPRSENLFLYAMALDPETVFAIILGGSMANPAVSISRI